MSSSITRDSGPARDADPAAVEIQTLARLDRALGERTSLAGLRIQDLDLSAREDALLRHTDMTGLVVLGGRLTQALDTHLRAHGAIVFPTDPGAPVDPYRSRLYAPEELYEGIADQGYDHTPDARAYAWLREGSTRHDAYVTLLRAIHDDSVTDALDEFVGCLDAARVVGVMGGHAVARDSRAYAAAARLGRTLAAAGLTVATGGGPGAMEAANLGAYCADGELSDALRHLAQVPSFLPSIEEWATTALGVRADIPSTGLSAEPLRSGHRLRSASIGIPTWFYGHEPPNVFCHAIAKYFSNAIREDGLLSRATAGLVILEGAAGTVQEVFQAATRMYYAHPGADVPPMVLVGTRHWTETVPVWPALTALGRDRPMGAAIHLVDSVDEAGAILTAL